MDWAREKADNNANNVDSNTNSVNNSINSINNIKIHKLMAVKPNIVDWAREKAVSLLLC